MARKKPSTFISKTSPPFLSILTPVTPASSPRTSRVLQFQRISMLGVSRTLFCMASDARSTSRRTIM